MFRMSDNLVYRRVKEALGMDRCVSFFTGAAPIPEQVVR